MVNIKRIELKYKLTGVIECCENCVVFMECLSRKKEKYQIASDGYTHFEVCEEFIQVKNDELISDLVDHFLDEPVRTKYFPFDKSDEM